MKFHTVMRMSVFYTRLISSRFTNEIKHLKDVFFRSSLIQTYITDIGKKRKIDFS